MNNIGGGSLDNPSMYLRVHSTRNVHRGLFGSNRADELNKLQQRITLQTRTPPKHPENTEAKAKGREAETQIRDPIFKKVGREPNCFKTVFSVATPSAAKSPT